MIRKLLLAITTVGALFVSAATYAAPTVIDLTEFDATDTVVDFNSLANQELVTNQFSGSGVTFSGELYGMTNLGDVSLYPSNGGVIASNWLYGDQGAPSNFSFTATFSSVVNRVGFYMTNWNEDTVVLEFFNNGVSLGTLPTTTQNGLTSNFSVEFKGFQDNSGFDEVVFTVANNNNGFFAMDSFTFGASNVAAIPEPETYAMFLAGLGLLGFVSRRKLTA